MISRFIQIQAELEQMTAEVRANKAIPHPELALDTSSAFNEMRSALVALDIALHARHNERHPILKPQDYMIKCTCSEPFTGHEVGCPCYLDPETRAAIDATP